MKRSSRTTTVCLLLRTKTKSLEFPAKSACNQTFQLLRGGVSYPCAQLIVSMHKPYDILYASSEIYSANAPAGDSVHAQRASKNGRTAKVGVIFQISCSLCARRHCKLPSSHPRWSITADCRDGPTLKGGLIMSICLIKSVQQVWLLFGEEIMNSPKSHHCQMASISGCRKSPPPEQYRPINISHRESAAKT